MKRCIFLDRDGTLCEEMNYLDDYRKMIIYPFANEAVKIMKEMGYLVFVITNQSGVARGKFSLEEAERQKEHLLTYFRDRNASLNGYFYCPHHKDGVVPQFAIDCDCRKPKTGLLKQAVDWKDIDKDNSYVVGDKLIDIELAKRAGIKGILVLTGYGKEELKKAAENRDFEIYDNLLSFAKSLKER